MEIPQPQLNRLGQFLAHLETETYPEPPAEPHLSITKRMFGHFLKNYPRPEGKILDVGCGQGLALDLFSENGFEAIGITLNNEDLSVCGQKGHPAFQMDQSFLSFEDSEFSFIWCRHCLEHSIFPYFTLSGFFRILCPGGYLYVEVPAPDTSCNHQTNTNHYSVLGKSMWVELFHRAGFKILEVIDLSFRVPAGPDTYWAFIQRKA